jgi:hypothetical protein
MRKLIAVSLASGLGLFTVTAEAMPMTNLDGSSGAMITKVAQGCGIGMHRGPYGHCRPVFSCPRGWHPGPYGQHCFRNR